jgi:uncharacterized protein (DUF302 family)
MRSITWLLAGAFAVSIFAGCAASPEPAAPTPAPTIAAPFAVSEKGFEATVAAVEAAAVARGFTVVARIDHAKAAAAAELELRPLTVILFGNPKGGTPLMRQDPLIGLHLPLRVAVIEQADGSIAIAAPDMAQLLAGRTAPPGAIARLNGVLKAVVEESAK